LPQEPEAQDDNFVSGDPARALSARPRKHSDYSRTNDASMLLERARHSEALTLLKCNLKAVPRTAAELTHVKVRRHIG
jgi:hypothetical protein